MTMLRAGFIKEPLNQVLYGAVGDTAAGAGCPLVALDGHTRTSGLWSHMHATKNC